MYLLLKPTNLCIWLVLMKEYTDLKFTERTISKNKFLCLRFYPVGRAHSFSVTGLPTSVCVCVCVHADTCILL